jgi:hypothetical protein
MHPKGLFCLGDEGIPNHLIRDYYFFYLDGRIKYGCSYPIFSLVERMKSG